MSPSKFKTKQAIQLSNDDIITILILLQSHFAKDISNKQICHANLKSIKLIKKLKKIAVNNDSKKPTDLPTIEYIKTVLTVLENGIAKELCKIVLEQKATESK